MTFSREGPETVIVALEMRANGLWPRISQEKVVGGDARVHRACDAVLESNALVASQELRRVARGDDEGIGSVPPFKLDRRLPIVHGNRFDLELMAVRACGAGHAAVEALEPQRTEIDSIVFSDVDAAVGVDLISSVQAADKPRFFSLGRRSHKQRHQGQYRHQRPGELALMVHAKSHFPALRCLESHADSIGSIPKSI